MSCAVLIKVAKTFAVNAIEQPITHMHQLLCHPDID